MSSVSFLESKVTEIYCMADDFCKEFKFFSAIAACCFFEKKPVIDVNFVNDGQLSISEFYFELTLFIRSGKFFGNGVIYALADFGCKVRTAADYRIPVGFGKFCQIIAAYTLF